MTFVMDMAVSGQGEAAARGIASLQGTSEHVVASDLVRTEDARNLTTRSEHNSTSNTETSMRQWMTCDLQLNENVGLNASLPASISQHGSLIGKLVTTVCVAGRCMRASQLK